MQKDITLWHTLSEKELSSRLATNLDLGLSEAEAQNRKKEFGPNELQKETEAPWISTLFNQFKNPLILILLAAAGATFWFAEYTDSAVISLAIFLNTALGYAEERKSTKALASLQKILSYKAHVQREKKERIIPQEDLVPGDIILLKPGSKIPADARILQSFNLQIAEATLTGEWLPSPKCSGISNPNTPMADRDNMAYMGTLVEQGSGKAIVVATGKQTELGTIGKLLATTKEETTPYQQQLAKFSWIMGGIVTLFSIFLFAEGLLFGKQMFDMFKTAVAVAVSAIPEGLPMAMTVILAIGAQRILKQKGLIRRLSSAETLGSATVIATDKTLTLTEGSMQMESVIPLKAKDKNALLRAMALANEAFEEEMQNKIVFQGRPTDKALATGAIEAGFSKRVLEENLPLLLRIPFSSETGYIASFHKQGKETLLCVAGNPEKIIEKSLISNHKRALAEKALLQLAEQGLRVIAIAQKLLPPKESAGEGSIYNMLFLGFVALKDPLRKGVKEAIQLAKQANIRVIIVTGDHMLTAKAVAKELGLPHEKRNILEGKDLALLPQHELSQKLGFISVFARVEPTQKLAIVKALQERGEVVAMTGDGVNDAPALKKADIGLALGSGTDVAKESADLVMLNDDFAIIPAAIKEGRVITDNIQKTLAYLLSGTFTEIMLIGTAIILGLPLPLAPLQILWINIVEDAFPGMAFATEKPEEGVMTRSPAKKGSSLLTKEIKILIFFVSIITDILLLAIFFFLLSASFDFARIQTIVFVGLGITALLYAFSIRSLRRNIWEYNPFSNKYINLSVLFGFAMLFLAVYHPWLNAVLDTVPLELFDWILLFGLGIFNVALTELVKYKFKKTNAK